MSLLQVAEAGDEGDDILMAMARELVTEKGIGESAAAVWLTSLRRIGPVSTEIPASL